MKLTDWAKLTKEECFAKWDAMNAEEMAEFETMLIKEMFKEARERQLQDVVDEMSKVVAKLIFKERSEMSKSK